MSKKSALLSGGRKEEEDSLAEYSNMAKNCAFWPELFGNDNAQLVHDDFARRFSMCLNFAAGHSVKWASHFVDTGFIALEVSTLEAGYESISEFLDCSSPSQLSTLFNHTFNLPANSSMLATLEILRDLINAPREYFQKLGDLTELSPMLFFKMLTTVSRADPEADARGMERLFNTASKFHEYFSSICANPASEPSPSFEEFSLFFIQYHVLMALKNLDVLFKSLVKALPPRTPNIAEDAKTAVQPKRLPTSVKPPPRQDPIQPRFVAYHVEGTRHPQRHPGIARHPSSAAAGITRLPPQVAAAGKSAPPVSAVCTSASVPNLMYYSSGHSSSDESHEDNDVHSTGEPSWDAVSALSLEQRWHTHTSLHPPDSPGSHVSGVPTCADPALDQLRNSYPPPHKPLPRFVSSAPTYLDTPAMRQAYDAHEDLVQRKNTPTMASLAEAMTSAGGMVIPTIQGPLLDLGHSMGSFNASTGTFKNKHHLSEESKLLLKIYNPDQDPRIDLLKQDMSFHYVFYSRNTLTTFLNNQAVAISDKNSQYSFVHGVSVSILHSRLHEFRTSISRIAAKYLTHDSSAAPYYVVALATFMRFVWRTWSYAFAKRSFASWNDFDISESWRHDFYQDLALVQESVMANNLLVAMRFNHLICSHCNEWGYCVAFCRTCMFSGATNKAQHRTFTLLGASPTSKAQEQQASYKAWKHGLPAGSKHSSFADFLSSTGASKVAADPASQETLGEAARRLASRQNLLAPYFVDIACADDCFF